MSEAKCVETDGLPPLGTLGLYAIKVGDNLVKFGRTETCITRRLAHHQSSLRGLGVGGFTAIWIQHPEPRKAERELLTRLRRSGFETGAGKESFAMAWSVALRFLNAVADRSA